MNKNSNILYITTLIQNFDTIFDKVLAQCDGMKMLGYNVDLVHIGKNYTLCINNEIKVDLRSKLGSKLLYFHKLLNFINFEDYEILYIRNVSVIDQISYFRFLKMANKYNCKIILEIPTFPYKLELLTFSAKLLYLSEILFRNNLKKYISIILYSGNKLQSIYGIKCMQLVNIGNTNSLPISTSMNNVNCIKFIGVSNCSSYHGYDRIIEGLNLYYKNSNLIPVEFHIVGSGPFLDTYIYLTAKYSLEKYIFFHGPLTGQSLDELFDKMDIGISCLGMHRIGLAEGSPLKTAEYAIRGLSFVLAYFDNTFSGKKFCHTVSSNESPVEIGKIVNWYISNQFNKKDIREYTLQNVSWERQFEEIFSAL